MKWNLITILGPTASGKTELAVAIADLLHSEIISADSRQVYRRMDIGTGKDLSAYLAANKPVPYHLINIREPGEKYNVFEYQRDFFLTYHKLRNEGKLPLLCGGTGMYIEAVLRGYRLREVPPNPALRLALQDKSLDELSSLLAQPHIDTTRRAIRAIEIEEFHRQDTLRHTNYTPPLSLVLGLHMERETRRQAISRRLRARLEEGMLDEVQRLLDEGLSPQDLIYYGLEYKFLTLHLTGALSYQNMVQQLETAIHQFAKRQMTWFRGMERRGIPIHWIDADLPLHQKLSFFTYLCHPHDKRREV
ncbi:MAG: tRNA (adenosine(37)-N6)-dimethylallyltransferase MiaA [Tannerellaceae bacterium]|jgi:tRNA dimethylallyltransferase|nr:tRNA (adenosine(37)-N6)-dimethylallyltransferase MiaA [Tannerellaceae bacterium]